MLVLLSRVPSAVRCHATQLRRGPPSGCHRGRAGSDGVASHKAGFRSRRFPAPACSGITLPLAVPRSSQRAVPATPGCETSVSHLPSGSKRTENPGPWVLARGSLGACAAVAGQSALFGFPSAFVTAAVDPVTPPLGLPAPPRPSQPLPALLPSRGSAYSGLGAALRCGFCGLVPPWGSRSFSSL